VTVTVICALALAGCGDDATAQPPASDVAAPVTSAPASVFPSSPAPVSASTSASLSPTPRSSPTRSSPTPGPAASKRPQALPSPGNPGGDATVPAEARAVDTSRPDRVVGKGTPDSCTSAGVVAAVAAGGVITFNCGPAPVTITMNATAKVRNDHGPDVVLDGGGRVTLSGGGNRRILYQNTCDQAQRFTTSHCQDQPTPRLTVQNLTFTRGNATGQTNEGGGGGAIFVRGGRLKVVNSRFTGNRCDSTGPDLGGAAIRVLSQSANRPVYVVHSTFTGGRCSNGGALSSIGVSWTVLNSVFTGNKAIGRGANPAKAGTAGGGSGGAIYTDGNTFTVNVQGTVVRDNHANEGGGAIFFVSNDRTGTLTIARSTLKSNPSDGFETQPGIFFLGAHLNR
jgi:polymorphic membrane protein